AEGEIATWEASRARGEIPAPASKRPDGPTVRALYQEWWLPLVEKRPGLQPATLAGYRTSFGAVLLALNVAETGALPRTLGDEPAAALDVPYLVRLVGRLREAPKLRGLRGKPPVPVPGKTIGASRACNVFSALSMFLSDAVANKQVPFNSN